MDFKRKWELLKDLLPASTKGKIILGILAFLLMGLTIPVVLAWFIIPIEKFIDSKAKAWGFIAAVIVLTTAIFGNIPTESSKAVTGYTRIYVTVKDDNTGKTTPYEMFSPIQVVKNDNSDLWNVYADGVKIGQIKKTDVVFEGTPEYEQTKEEKANIDKKAAEMKKQIEEKLKAERQKQLAELEKNINAVFYKVELKKYSDDGTGIYDFYINPVVWAGIPFDQKENVFKNCVAYVQLKTNGTDPNSAKYGTKIKSSSNAAVLAEYTVFGGIQVK